MIPGIFQYSNLQENPSNSEPYTFFRADYFPDDDPARAPVNGWCTHGRLLFGNWLDEIRRAAVGEPSPNAGLWSQMAARWQMAGFAQLLGECR